LEGFYVRKLVLLAALVALVGSPPLEAAKRPRLMLALGDSLGQGTMDATNNLWASANAYLARVYESLRTVEPVHFSQPFYDFSERRIAPYIVPTNLAVDGADVFTIEGLRYGKRAGSSTNEISSSFLADHFRPAQFADDYDKVLFPTNLYARRPMSQVDSAIWVLDRWAPSRGIKKALCFVWIGNNDSSSAALGRGGSHPTFQPLPFFHIAPKIDPVLFWLMFFGAVTGEASFSPYTAAAIDRNLTDVDDFTAQYDAVLSRLQAETAGSGVKVDFLLLTLPYYSAVGYLFDADDLEYYLRKIDPGYSLPASFARVLPGEPLSGDRVALLTFGFMYALLDSGYPASYVNSILDVAGIQQDGLVLSEAEQRSIMARIDEFNEAIRSLAASHASERSSMHVIDVGGYLNEGLLGHIQIPVKGRLLGRKWVRGGALSFDGVHPNPTGQSLIANYILEQIHAQLGIEAPLYSLDAVAATDPYWDKDGDGWAPGPPWTASGAAAILHLLRDADDTDPSVGVVLPEDIWERFSAVLLEQLLDIPAIRAQAVKMKATSRR
jgi:lysophospholipase L1-like esterase